MTSGPVDPPVGAVVVAAGTGERLGAGRPKALVEVGGVSLVAHAVAALRAAGIEHVVVVHTPGEAAAFAAAVGDRDVVLVPGGADRSASVRAGLAALPEDIEVVAVHDAARAFTPPDVIRAVVAAVVGGGTDPATHDRPASASAEAVIAAAPAVPIADTLKRVDGTYITGTVDRSDVVAVQTPQVFPTSVLRAAIADEASATDDLALVERHLADGRLRGRVVWVPGSSRGLKVTHPEDLTLAEAWAAGVPTT